MSLIDEALKRAQEASRPEGAAPEARPWTPAPLPDAGLARRRKAVRALAWSLGAAVAFVAAGVLVRAVWNASAPEPSGAPAAAPAPSPAPTLPETVVTTPIPAAPAAATDRPRPTRPPAPDRPAEPAGTPAAEERPAPAAPRSIVSGRNYVGAADLPGGGRIELGGIVWSEEQPRALLNDRIVAVDAYVEGFTVTKIEEGRVVLEKDGVTISISLK